MDLDYITKHFETISKIIKVGGVSNEEIQSPEELKRLLEDSKSSNTYIDGLVKAIETKDDAYLKHFKNLLNR